MADINKFVHLALPLKQKGIPKFSQYKHTNDITNSNKINRNTHGINIKNQASILSHFWKTRRSNRIKINLPEINIGVPFLLEIDYDTGTEFLRGLGFEIVCEVSNGFVIVASENAELEVFLQKIEDFISNKKNSGTSAKVHAFHDDSDRLARIMSIKFKEMWENLNEETIYNVEISISCAGIDSASKSYKEWDEIAEKRQDEIRKILSLYIECDDMGSFTQENDSFSFSLKICGKGLRDFVLNYPYIFEVKEHIDIKMEDSKISVKQMPGDLTIIPPDINAPIVCVIDSGIQEGHKYITSAILDKDSKSFIPNTTNTDDEVVGGGHGTRVAGAILYPNGIPQNGYYKLPCFIRNFKILDKSNKLPESVDPTNAIYDITNDLSSSNCENPTKIYNQSIAEHNPFTDFAYMSSWAAQIDLQSYDKDILFIQAVGNLENDFIVYSFKKGLPYPEYFGEEFSRIANPAQSLQALTVGSVSANDYETADFIALGKEGEVSAFSRIGPGIWDSIKPDVVEFGGTYAINKNGKDFYLTTPSELCPELIRKSPPGKAFDRDNVGTSFATPKVSFIASEIEKVLPKSHALLYRALIAQSARWFDFEKVRSAEECENMLRRVGYGIPNVERATFNSEYRVTLITSELVEIEEKEAHIYNIKIPEELKSVGENFDILIEVTLSYAANPRRTRRLLKGYLSTWVDWICSKKGESPDSFMKRIFEVGSSVEDDGNFNWMLGERRGNGIGQVPNISRKTGTLQKDWCVVKSNQLTDEFCIAVRGHKGWNKLFKAKYSLAVSFEAINQDVEIYEPIKVLNEIEIENDEIEVEISNR